MRTALVRGDSAQQRGLGHALVDSWFGVGGGSDKRRRVLHGQFGRTQAFVVSEVNGACHTAIEAPGTAALNKGGHAQVNSVSCPSGQVLA